MRHRANSQTGFGVTQEIMQRSHQRDRNNCCQHIAFGYFDITGKAQTRNIVKIGTKRLSFSTPDEIGDIHQRHGHTESADDHPHAGNCIATTSARQAPVKYPFDSHSKQCGKHHRANQRNRVGNADIVREDKPEKGSKHIHLTMGKMHDVQA